MARRVHLFTRARQLTSQAIEERGCARRTWLLHDHSLEVSKLYDDFNVRDEVALIETLDESPIRKARMLLAIARRMRLNADCLTRLGAYHVRIGNPQIGATFHDAGLRMRVLHAEIRLLAARSIEPLPEPIGFGLTPQGNAYPVWTAASLATPAGGER